MKTSRPAQVFIAALTILGNASTSHADSPAEAEAREYMRTWEERGREACKDNERGCAAAGHALDRAAAAYERAGKIDKAIAIRKMILDPQWHLDYTDYARTAAFALARNQQSIALFAEAAQIIETSVRRFSKSDEAPDALLEAIDLRLGLGEIDRANEDLELFSKHYGAKRPLDAARTAVSVGLAFWKYGQTNEALKLLGSWMPLIDRQNIHVRMSAHALAGRIHAQGKSREKAAAEYEIVRSAWVRPDESVKQIEALGGAESERSARLTEALTVLGEAMFFFAEQKRAEVEAIRFPAFNGSGDKDSILAFINTQASPWLVKKRDAIEAADREYQKILSIQPVPPPRWVVAGAGRVGFLWADFVADFRRAPTPKEWNSDKPLPNTTMPGPEIKKLYLEQLSTLSEPLLERSKQAFRFCVERSVKFQWADEHSQACVGWLEKNDRQRWIPVEEIKSQPVHSPLFVKFAPIVPD
ncbi:MAG TPA: hypothetical protein PKA58_18915 [Polyangium sp.]|nr:hypothetical protein [Polyangium sp.]